jgi:hypothetical protein
MDELSKMHEDMQIERGGRERGEMFEKTRRIEDVHTSRKNKNMAVRWLNPSATPLRITIKNGYLVALDVQHPDY